MPWWLAVVFGLLFLFGAVPLWRRRHDPEAQRGARIQSELPFAGERLTPRQMVLMSALCVLLGAAFLAGGVVDALGERSRMGLFDRLTGTKRPDGEVVAQPADVVRRALLAVGTHDAPYALREADDGGLEAEWRVEEPTWRTYFAQRDVDRTIRVTMRLKESGHEVRHVTEQLTVTREQGGFSVRREESASRGSSRTVCKRWTLGGGDGAKETFSFDSAKLTRALEAACLQQGWTWKGVPVGKL